MIMFDASAIGDDGDDNDDDDSNFNNMHFCQSV